MTADEHFRTIKRARKITAFPTCVVDAVFMQRVMTVPKIISASFVPGFVQQYKLKKYIK